MGRPAVSKCPRGHLYDEENTYVSRFGDKYCRACARIRWQEKRARYAGLDRDEVSRYVSAAKIGQLVGLHEQTIRAWAKKGLIPFVRFGVSGGVVRFDPSVVVPEISVILQRSRRRRGAKTCSRCRKEKPLKDFNVVRYKGKKPTHSDWVGPSAYCRECNAQQKREDRAKRAGFSSWDEWRRAVRAEREARAQAVARERAAALTEKLERESKTERKRTASTLRCNRCGLWLPRSRFHSSELDDCRECVSVRDREQFQKDCKNLTDRYIRKLLTKRNGLRSADVPMALVEAKRAQMMVQRAVSPRKAKED